MIQDFELGYLLGLLTVVGPIVALKFMAMKSFLDKHIKRLEELGESLERKKE